MNLEQLQITITGPRMTNAERIVQEFKKREH